MKKFFITLLILLCFIGCKESDLNRALSMAGDNADELKAVLNYYSHDPRDSLKYRAALFLIENMPGHYSLGGRYIDLYYDSVDSLLSFVTDKESLKQKIDSIAEYYKLSENAIRLEDVEHITANFLINNIERAFEVWPKGGYAEHLSFDQFCEYILPYRVGNEPIEFWRDSLKNKYNDIWAHGYHEGWRHSAFHACCEINNRLREEAGVYLLPPAFPIEKYSILARMFIGDCDSYGARATFAMRAKGVPVVKDFTPQWAYRDMGHSWNVVLCNNGRELSFGGVDVNPDVIHKPDAKMAKVYRTTFARNKESLASVCKGEPIPSNLKSPFYKDVTSQYLETSNIDVDIKVLPKENRQFMYLSLFNNKKWIPVCFAKIRFGDATFNSVGRDIVYLPSYYVDREMQPANYPFLLDSRGRIHYYEPDTLNVYNLRIYRKYPAEFRMVGVASHMIGGEFQAADNPEFKNAIVLHRIEENPYGLYVTIPLDSVLTKYRYWRHVSPIAGYGNIAELQFWGENGELLNPSGKIIGTDGTWGNDPKRSKESAFDNDPLTFFDSSKPDSAWVGLEFPKPVAVKKIVYLPRNDGNNVAIGDEYELFYYSIKGWKSLGRKKAKTHYVEFADVPRNAVLWLHNHTQGQEERIFTFDGKSTFWW